MGTREKHVSTSSGVGETSASGSLAARSTPTTCHACCRPVRSVRSHSNKACAQPPPQSPTYSQTTYFHAQGHGHGHAPSFPSRERERETCHECLVQVVGEFRKHMNMLRQRRRKLAGQVDQATRTGRRLREQREERLARERNLRGLRDRVKVLERRVEEKRKANAQRKRQLPRMKRDLLERLRDECEISQAEKVARTFPSLLGKHKTWHRAIAEQLVREQRSAMETLLHILPVQLDYHRGQEEQEQEEEEAFLKTNRPKPKPKHKQQQQKLVLRLRVCGVNVPLTMSQVRQGSLKTLEDEQELGSGLGYFLLLVDLTARILQCPLLHVTGLDQTNGSGRSGGSGFLMGFGLSHSTIWQPKSYWQLIPSDVEEDLPLYLQHHLNNTGTSTSSSCSCSSKVTGGETQEEEEEEEEGFSVLSPAASSSSQDRQRQEAQAKAPTSVVGIGEAICSEVMRGVQSVTTSVSPIAIATALNFGKTGLPFASAGGAASGYASLEKGLRLLQRSVGMFCGHAVADINQITWATTQEDKERGRGRNNNGQSQTTSSPASSPQKSFVFDGWNAPTFALLVEVCSKYAGCVKFVNTSSPGTDKGGTEATKVTRFIQASQLMADVNVNASAVMEGGGGGSVLGQSAAGATGFGLDFSVIANPKPREQQQPLEEWDFV